MADANIPQESESSRDRVTRRLFIGADGTAHPRVMPDVQRATLVFLQEDEEYEAIDMDFGILPGFNDLPHGACRQAIAWGAMTAVSNTAGSAKLSLDEKVEVAAARWSLIAEDKWVSEREGTGPRTSDLVEAALRFQVQAGQPMTEAQKAEFIKRIENPAERKRVQGLAPIAALIQAIRLERQQVRAAKAAERAKAQQGPISLLG